MGQYVPYVPYDIHALHAHAHIRAHNIYLCVHMTGCRASVCWWSKRSTTRAPASPASWRACRQRSMRSVQHTETTGCSPRSVRVCWRCPQCGVVCCVQHTETTGCRQRSVRTCWRCPLCGVVWPIMREAFAVIHACNVRVEGLAGGEARAVHMYDVLALSASYYSLSQCGGWWALTFVSTRAAQEQHSVGDLISAQKQHNSC